jgi:hypothetical protein
MEPEQECRHRALSSITQSPPLSGRKGAERALSHILAVVNPQWRRVARTHVEERALGPQPLGPVRGEAVLKYWSRLEGPTCWRRRPDSNPSTGLCGPHVGVPPCARVCHNPFVYWIFAHFIATRRPPESLIVRIFKGQTQGQSPDIQPNESTGRHCKAADLMGLSRRAYDGVNRLQRCP